MEKTKQRVSKCLMITSALAILLATSGDSVSGDVVKIEPIKYNVMGVNKQIESMKAITKVEPTVEVEQESQEIWLDFKMTHYVANCSGCNGKTYTGYDVRNTIYYEGYRVLSVDPKIINEGSIVEIDDNGQKFMAIALDRGGKIKGRKLDLLVKGVKEAYKQGNKDVKLRVVREGWQEDVK